jgi:transcriptional regulator with XRE-family HTH domain
MSGSEFRARREALGYTQAVLASLLGVAANTLARWERDELPIPPIAEPALRAVEAGLVTPGE